MANHKAALLAKIDAAEARVGIIGLGYVGLPLALAFAEKGFAVIGFDVDQRKVGALARGESYIDYLEPARVRAARDAGRLEATTDFARLAEPDAILVCVPTPLTPQRDPDLSFVLVTAEQIAARLRPGQLIVLESTTYPGTTEEVVKPLLERGGLRSGKDFFLAFSPERQDPGNIRFDTVDIPKVVGGADVDSGDVADALYARAISRTVRVSSAAAAEATKITENVFRAINIALVNELKVIYERMGIDIWEVLDAAATKPFGFMRFDPGPGWGGHCIPLDPFYLSWKARALEVDTKFIELAGEINRAMPEYVIGRLQQALNERSKSIKGSKLLVLGVAYKRDVGDTRESPAMHILRRLRELGAEVGYHDPHVEALPDTRSWPGHPDMRSVALTPALVGTQDAVLVVTNHTAVDYDMILKHAKLIVDSRGMYRGARANVVKA